MQIKSQFKDYYDFVAHQYGGGDPKVTYSRHRLQPLTKLSGDTDAFDLGINVDHRGIRDLPNQYYSLRESNNFKFQWLVVAGKYYCLVRRNDDFPKWQIITEETFDLALPYHRWKKHPMLVELVGNDGGEPLIELSRKLNAPVFVIRSIEDCRVNANWRQKLTINGEVPILSDLGLPKIISPEQLYQDIAYFVGNTMHGSPDIDTPAKVNNDDRILQHGFDLKQSFRHRK